MRRFVAAQLCTVFALAVAGGTAAAAPPPLSDDPYKPPLFDYGNGSISLLEVVRLTLANDPNLKLQVEEVRQQAGILQQQTGAFDSVLNGSAGYSYQETQIRESQLQSLTQSNQQTVQSASDVCNSATTADQTLAQLLTAQTAPPGTIQVPADTSINTQLSFIDSLLAQATDPAQRQALLNTRLSFINAEIAQARTNSANDHFGCTQANLALQRLGAVPRFEDLANATLNIELDTLMRNGVTLSPFINSTYSHDQYRGKKNGFYQTLIDENGNVVNGPDGKPIPEFINFGGTNIPDLYKTSAGFKFDFPLLRNSGRTSVDAPERAAERQLEAARFTARQQASTSVLAAITAYWTLNAAQQRVDILTRSADLESQLVKITDQLIAGDEIPRAERSRALAGEANARAQLEAAQRDLVTARLELVKTMGLGASAEKNAPLADGLFPAPPTSEALAAVQDPQALLQVAIGNRFDLRAAQMTQQGDAILAEAARLNTRTQFDISGAVEATGQGEQTIGNGLDRWARPGGSLKATYSRPAHNDALLGLYVQAQAQLGEQQITTTDLGRTIQIAVVQDLATLALAVEHLHEAKLAAQYAQETIDGEVEKLKAGESTLVDAILTEQQRTASVEDMIAAQQDVATLLAQVRFDTGTLVRDSANGKAEVLQQDLVTLPAAVAGGNAGSH
jgi:outer membrane protein TolC